MIKLKLPISNNDYKNIKSGDLVLLSGTIYTARDAAHKRIVDSIKNNSDIPFDLNNGAIYYVGPTPTKPGDIIGSCGPTSSYRMDPFMDTLLQKGLKVTIGKGDRNKEIDSLSKKYEHIYFIAIGGTAAKLATCVTKSEIIAYEDLGSEAVRKLEITDFPVICGIDTKGDSIL